MKHTHFFHDFVQLVKILTHSLQKYKIDVDCNDIVL